MSDPITFSVRNTDSHQLILFIHGFSGESHTTFGMLPAFLAGDPRLANWDIACFGYPTKLAPDVTGIWQADPDLTVLAGLLGSILIDERFLKYKELALLAHSMGGLIVQRALANGIFKDRVKFVLLFGTPSNGLRKAGLAKLFKRQARDMTFGGEFINRLRKDWNDQFSTNMPFVFYAVAGVRDEFVPVSSSVEVFDIKYRRYVNGNHLEMVKPQTTSDDAAALIKTVLVNNQKNGIDDTITQQHQQTISTLTNAQTKEELGKLALALEMTGKQDEAIRLLTDRYTEHTDLAGILAGRLKRRWLAEPVEKESDGLRAYEIYAEAFKKAQAAGDDSQAFYNGINQAFMELAFYHNRYNARMIALEVLQHCRKAKKDFWRLATEGEANLYLGEYDFAIDCYEAALSQKQGPNPRETDSMYKQAIWVTRLLKNNDTEQRLTQLFAPYLSVQ